LGVTGFAGHPSVLNYMQEQCPLRVLVLGTRLSESLPSGVRRWFLRVGSSMLTIDPEVPGVAYPSAETFAIQSDVGAFVLALLKRMAEHLICLLLCLLPHRECTIIEPSTEGAVRPEVLMDAIQHVIVEESDAVVMAESVTPLLGQFTACDLPNQDVSESATGFGAMGHLVTGVVGAAFGGMAKLSLLSGMVPC
jgi:acetolactate synthase-1/2/3 large subunit